MKYLKFIYILLLVTLLSGCVFNDPKYINLRTKPNLYYYSNEIYEKIKNNKSYSLKVFDVNFYEYHEVSEEDEDILPCFLESLNNDNYVSELNLEDEKVKYKLNPSAWIYGANSLECFCHNRLKFFVKIILNTGKNA